jgi:hypothetical protein
MMCAGQNLGITDFALSAGCETLAAFAVPALPPR